MLPKQYITETQALAKRRERAEKIAASLTFIVSFLAVGPLIHEISHIAVLLAIKCPYTIETGVHLLGFRASIQPFCTPGNLEILGFYLAGYSVTLFSSISALFVGIYRSGDKSGSSFYNAISAGIATSIILSVSKEGDIAEISNLLGGAEPFELFLMLFFVTASSAVVLKSLQMGWDISEG